MAARLNTVQISGCDISDSLDMVKAQPVSGGTLAHPRKEEWLIYSVEKKTMSNLEHLVPNRECGACSVCCVSLRINDGGLKKIADVPCQHLCQRGCGIYTERPTVCKNWYCAWRIFPTLGDEWRPDISKILIKCSGNKIILQPLKPEHSKKLAEESLLTILAKFITSGFNVETSIPTRPGFCNSLMTINDKFKDAIEKRDLIMAKILMKKVIFISRHSNTLPEPLLDD